MLDEQSFHGYFGFEKSYRLGRGFYYPGWAEVGIGEIRGGIDVSLSDLDSSFKNFFIERIVVVEIFWSVGKRFEIAADFQFDAPDFLPVFESLANR